MAAHDGAVGLRNGKHLRIQRIRFHIGCHLNHAQRRQTVQNRARFAPRDGLDFLMPVAIAQSRDRTDSYRQNVFGQLRQAVAKTVQATVLRRAKFDGKR